MKGISFRKIREDVAHDEQRGFKREVILRCDIFPPVWAYWKQRQLELNDQLGWATLCEVLVLAKILRQHEIEGFNKLFDRQWGREARSNRGQPAASSQHIKDRTRGRNRKVRRGA